MRITVSCTDTRIAPWIEGLRAALPGAEVEEWRPGAPQADHAVVWVPPQQMLDEQPALKGIFNIGAGVDALMRLKLPPQALVVRLDDAGMSVQMAEYVCHAVIRHFREFDVYEREAAAGKWGFRKPRARADFPVGVLGLGVLGQRVAQALATFEFPVLGWSRSAREVAGVTCFAGESQFDAFLAGSRVLVNLLPLTPDPQDILNRRTLAKLRPGGYVINVARGAHLVEEDLIPLIDSGQLAGATLDVFRNEPLPSEHPFWRHPQIMLTPHIASVTQPETAARSVIENIKRHRAGLDPIGLVDRSRGY